MTQTAAPRAALHVEMTDAAMAIRAECVMRNKGAAVVGAVAVHDKPKTCTNEHLFRKTPTPRAARELVSMAD